MTDRPMAGDTRPMFPMAGDTVTFTLPDGSTRTWTITEEQAAAVRDRLVPQWNTLVYRLLAST